VSDTLPQYAAKCDAAIGVTVPDFDCDAGTLVPTTHLAGGRCDRPNRLNGVCDPGSRFQVLTRTADAYVVAHCRKKGLGARRYGVCPALRVAGSRSSPVRSERPSRPR